MKQNYKNCLMHFPNILKYETNHMCSTFSAFKLTLDAEFTFLQLKTPSDFLEQDGMTRHYCASEQRLGILYMNVVYTN